MTTSTTADWNYPTRIRVGAGRAAEIADICEELGVHRPLVVTDPGLARLPIFDEVIASARARGLETKVFSDIKSNPTGRNIEAGVASFSEGHHDSVIALGGGSAMDAGKTVATIAGQQGGLWDYIDAGHGARLELDPTCIAPSIAIPTTAGTGSEVGRAAVITCEEEQIKRILWHALMLPAQVVLDPLLTVSLPPHLTAATGMDALSHNLEALCASGYHPMAEGIAMQGIKLVKEYLPQAHADGDNLEARTRMLTASTMGATAFQRGLGGIHALAHPLGALYDSHHGLLNAILMPYVLNANRVAIQDVLTDAARSLALPNPCFESFMAWVLALREQLGIPPDLGAIGIDSAQAERVGQMAAEDSCAQTNPILLTARQYQHIFEQAVTGEL